jgi:hypothetical protein
MTTETVSELTASLAEAIERVRENVTLVTRAMQAAAMQIQASHEIIAAMLIANDTGKRFDSTLIREGQRYLEGKVMHVTTVERRFKTEVVQGFYAGPVTPRDLEERFYHEHFGGRDAKLLVGNRFSVVRHLD